MTEPTLHNEVRRFRERLGLSQHDLSALVGVSRQAIVGIEGGRQVPSTALSLRLARALRSSCSTKGNSAERPRCALPRGTARHRR
jgi:putative transcriptional regulator